MAYYGIPSAGQTLTASNGADTVAIANLGGTLVTAQSVYGADGNDIISLGAVGRIATGSATFSGNIGAISGSPVFSGSLSASIVGSATWSTGISFTTGGSGAGFMVTSVAFSTAVTSQQAARTVNAAYFQGNAGNDTIAFGESITRVSATTFAGGQGADVIGSYKNLNNVFTGTTNSALFVSTDIEGGKGNDTIYLDNEAFSALNVNGNVGADKVEFVAFSALENSIIGLGADGDTLSAATIGSAASSTIAGGKGNDTISIEFTNATNVVVGGDRANAVAIDGDGNDSIWIKASTIFSAGTIYGGGGNDTLTFSGDVTASTISLGAGFDVYSAQATNIVKDTTIGLGNQGDEFHVVDGVQVLSSKINLGKGLDTTDFGGADVGSGADFAATTIFGGAGADYLLGSAAHSAADTVETILEYAANTDSTISAYDTVALDVTNSGTYQFRYEPGATQAAFSAAGLTATNGVVVFSSTFATDVTARASAIATNVSDGAAAGFLDGSGNAYLFVKGASDNLVVQVGSAASLSGVGTLGINASKNITLKIDA